MTTLQQIASLIFLTSISTGCTTTSSKEDTFPQTGPTMEEVYKSNINETSASSEPNYSNRREQQRPLADSEESLAGYTREANNEIQSIFPTLHNPTLVMYVFPHLSTNSRLPVPGYSTSFSMYERTEYALPGER